MESKLVYLMLVIICLWLLVNPKTREFIKERTAAIGVGG